MCFHNSMREKAENLGIRYNRKIEIIEEWDEDIRRYHINAFTNPDCPVVTNDNEIQMYKWGLIPFWTKTEADAGEIRRMTYNAKAETIFQKPSFREPIRKRRCLIPSTGYFEWRHDGDKKIPYYIFLKNEPIFSMAGIYDRWADPATGVVLETFSILTTEANPLTAYIHNDPKTGNRMPLILSKEDEEKWLNPELSEKDIASLLKPFPEKEMKAYVIEKDFIKKNPYDSSILQRA